MDMVVGFHSKSIDAVVVNNATKALVLLEAHGIMDASSVTNGLSGMVSRSMTTTLTQLTGLLDKAIKKLWKQLEHETFHLFDTTDTGTIEPIDLKNVAKIYNIP